MLHGFTPSIRVVINEDYIYEHSFNKLKFTCFVAKYSTAHIHMTFRSAAM